MRISNPWWVVILAVVTVACSRNHPEIEITSPEHNAAVNGLVAIAAHVTDDVEVNTLGLFIDDSLAYSVNDRQCVYVWNTFSLPESSHHEIYLTAHIGGRNPVVSDVIEVMVRNGTMLFADDFEMYSPGTYPTCGWCMIWPGSCTASVEEDTSSGNHCFKQSGVQDTIRTDAVVLDMTGIHGLVYEFRVMIPSTSSAGMLAGFYVEINPNLGTIFNGVFFGHGSGTIEVRGLDPVATGYSWKPATWHSVKVALDYENALMDVWCDDSLIAEDILAAPRDTSHTFAISTEFNSDGCVYYDDFVMYQNISLPSTY